ncbi:DUF4267 domain-containing protein [Kribbella shirazensis]|uniref:DUF4267 domain-containing protein n=1 Tax=Kribbella shirazensis TaxID=1105143 RepID=A0A7X6A0K9_9ACTN|nr:DUF4267 domain-containing protein [Kribbella shirazensis]NIK57261.1 hypothetical protein [Kribbella shirazensis]
MRRFTTVLTVLLGVFPLTFGSQYLFDGASAAANFGIDPWPTGTAAGYFAVKGIRDIALGLVVLALFALRQRRATGVVLAIVAIVPIVDMITVFSHGGPAATALGVHGLTAAVILVDAFLLLREREVTTGETLQPAHS